MATHSGTEAGRFMASSKPGDDGAQIADGLFLFHRQPAQVFDQDARPDADSGHQEGPPAENDDGGNQCRTQGNNHVEHDPAGGSPAPDMGRG